jgi:hypothetical protein
LRRARPSLRATLALAVAVALVAPGCGGLFRKGKPPAGAAGSPAPLPVKKASEEVVVRLTAAPGLLFSGGRVLVSDAAGQTRDRLTARRTTFITLNAGGTVYRFKVPVGGDEAPSR